MVAERLGADFFEAAKSACNLAIDYAAHATNGDAEARVEVAKALDNLQTQLETKYGLIAQFLKDKNGRLSASDGKWLVWDGLWVVYERPYRARNTICLYRGGCLASALAVLRASA